MSHYVKFTEVPILSLVNLKVFSPGSLMAVARHLMCYGRSIMRSSGALSQGRLGSLVLGYCSKVCLVELHNNSM